jgi:hypothetical protein
MNDMHQMGHIKVSEQSAVYYTTLHSSLTFVTQRHS